MRWAALLLFAALVWAQGQGDRPIPEYEGDGNPQHDGQPKWCQAIDVGGFKKNCGICDTKCGPGETGGEDKRCKVYCRKGACKCHADCQTHMKKDSPIKEGM